jgi:osmotically-inducible protein OsmY
MKPKSDQRITRDVLDELDWDPAVNLIEVNVATTHGNVQLSGTSETYRARLAAEEAALRVYGVRSIDNDIVVKPAVRNDTEIRDDIQTALAKDYYQAPNAGLAVSVDHGRVILSGQVKWHYQREAAVDDACMVKGVKSVESRIDLSQPEVNASTVHARIIRAFARNAKLHDENIAVVVRDQEVTLSGTVETLHERHLALDTAWMAPGVTSVVNHIDVHMP